MLKKSWLFLTILIILLTIVPVFADDPGVEGNSVEIEADTISDINGYFNNGSISSSDTVYLGNKSYSNDGTTIAIENLNNIVINGGTISDPDSYSTFTVNNGNLLTFTNGANITFLNIHFKGMAGQTENNPYMTLNSEDGYIKFINCTFDDIQSDTSNNVLELTAKDLLISGTNFTNIKAGLEYGPKNIINGNVQSVNISNSNFKDIFGAKAFTGTTSRVIFSGNNFTKVNGANGKSFIDMSSNAEEFIFINNYLDNVQSSIVSGSANSYNISNNNFTKVNGKGKTVIDFGTVSGEFVFTNNYLDDVQSELWSTIYSIINGTASSYNISNNIFNNTNGPLDFSKGTSDNFIISGNNFTKINAKGKPVIDFGTVSGEFVFTNNYLDDVQSEQYSTISDILKGTASSYNISDNVFNNTKGPLNFADGTTDSFVISGNNFTNIDSSGNTKLPIINFGTVTGDFLFTGNNLENVSVKYGMNPTDIITGSAKSYNISDNVFNNVNGSIDFSAGTGSENFIMSGNNFTKVNNNQFINFGTVTGEFVFTGNSLENVSSINNNNPNALITGSATSYNISDNSFTNISGYIDFSGSTSDKFILSNNNFTNIYTPYNDFINIGTVNGEFLSKNNNFTEIKTHLSNEYNNIITGTANDIVIDNSSFQKIDGSVFKFDSGSNLKIINSTFSQILFNDPIVHFDITGDFVCVNNTFSNMTSTNVVLDGTANTYVLKGCNFKFFNAGIVNFGDGEKCEISNINIDKVNLDSNLITTNSKNTNIHNCSFSDIDLHDQFVVIKTNGQNSNITNVTFTKCGNGEAIEVNGDNTIVSDIEFIGFYSSTDGSGLIIKSSHNLIENCTFINCTSNINGGSLVVKGGEYNVINNCTFINSTTTGSGGAIDVQGNNNIINNSYFEGNVATKAIISEQQDGGGAIYFNENYRNLTVANSYFKDNIGYNSGGAIRLAGSDSTIENCTFLGNYVETGGNDVPYGGGAIWAAKNLIVIKNSTFINNSAPYGGALRGAANITDSKFIGNNATDGNGGGIDMTIYDVQTNPPLVSVRDTLFYNNTAWGGYHKDDRSQGGGLHTYWLSGIIIENCTFMNNTAARGGGLDLYLVNESYINNNVFYNNSAIIGGGIALVGDNAILHDNEIKDNLAVRGAGAQIIGNNSEIYDCNITNNIANSGGGLWISGNGTLIKDSLIEWNEALMGGAIYKFGNTLNMTNVTVHHNTALLDVSSNITDLLALPIFVQYNFKFVQDGFDLNLTYDGSQGRGVIDYDVGLGGGLYTLGSISGQSIIDDCLFYHNTARNGSAIYAVPYSMLVNNTYFYSNSAWSYALPINFDSATINVGEKLKGNVTLIGGDNLINAIYNANSPSAFQLRNVTYEYYDGDKVVNRTTKVLATPVDGYENSEGGSVVYQDDRENNQIINITIKNKEDNQVVYQTSGRTDIAGNVYFETPELPVGEYTIEAVHKNGIPYHPNRDYYYTDIDNETNFAVIDEREEEVDVGVTKEANADSVYLGQEVTWTITVKNHGTITAENVVLNDVLPAGLEFVSADQEGYDSANGVWTIGNLDAGESKTLTIVSRTTAKGSIKNTATVTTDSVDVNPDNDEDDDTVEVVSVDVGVTKEADVEVANPGDTVTWTVTVTNNGDGLAKDVNVTDTLPAGLAYVSATASEGTYDSLKGVWTIGDLTAGQTVTLTIVSRVTETEEATITNIAKVTTSSPDTDPNNDEDSDDVEVEPVCDVSIEKVADPKTAVFEDSVTWTLTVKNNGPSVAKNVKVTDVLPANLDATSIVPSRGTYNADTGIWTIGDLNVNEEVTLTIVTKITVDANVNIVNTAKVTTTTKDSNPDNDEDSDDVDVTEIPLPKVDLVLTKEANETSVGPNAPVTWTIIVKNDGPEDAADVVVKDVLPAGLGYVSATASQGTYDAATGVWTIGSLANGATVTLTIDTIVNVNTAQTIKNEAEVNTSSNDTDPTNNKDDEDVEVVPVCDVAVEKVVSQTIANPDDTVTWTITVTNNGPSAAENVLVKDEIPANLDANSIVASKGTYDSLKNLWTIGDLAVNEKVTLTIVTKITATEAMDITNVAKANTTTKDSNPDNDEDNDTVKVTLVPKPEVDLVLTKEANETSVGPNAPVSWTITVTNNGPEDATDVVVKDVLPAGLGYVDATATKGTYNKDTGIWTIGDLANGATVTLTINTIVNVNTAQTIVNEAEVTTSSDDTNPDNNNDDDDVEVIPVCDVVVVKEVNQTVAGTNQEVTWTITVTNKGPSIAKDVVLKDVLPSGLEFVSADQTGYAADTGVWNIGDLDVDATVTLTIVSKVTALTGVNITNVAEATTTTEDSNTTNNKDNDTVEVDTVCDVGVEKTADKTVANPEDTVTWTITVTNNGPSVAKDVKVEDALPEGLEYTLSTTTVGNYADGIWTIGDLNPGQSVTLTIVNKVTALNNVNITNVAKVNTTTKDTNPENDKDNDTVEVIPLCDVEVVKVVNQTIVKPGESVTWTITVKNNGPQTAKDVVVDDLLPAGLEFVSANTATGTYANGIWTIGDVDVDGTVTLTLVTKVTETKAANLTNVAEATTTTEDTNPDNNKDNDTVEVIPVCDVAVVKVANETKVGPDSNVEWTITVTNHGPSAAENVNVTDLLPEGVEFVSANAGVGAYADGVWTIGDLEAGKSVSLTLVTKVTATTGNITNVAKVNTTTEDNNPDNDEDNETIDVVPVTDVAVTVTVNQTVVHPEDVISWNVTATNNGPSLAENVNVTDLLPEGLEVVDVIVPDGTSYDRDTNVWTIGDLSVGEELKLVIVTKVKEDATGNLTVEGTIETSTVDTNPNNNYDNDTTEVIREVPVCDLEVVKEVNQTTVNPGDTIEWTLTVTNNGPSAAEDVCVTDVLPAGLEFVDAAASVGNFENNVWIIGDLEADHTVTLTIITKVTETAAVNITNVAKVNTTTEDNKPDNDEDNDTVEVVPVCDVEVVKVANQTVVNAGESVTWTVTVTNNGPSTAENVKVTDVLPSGLESISANADVGAYAGGVWTVGDLEAGQTATLTIVTKVTSTADTHMNITNVAQGNTTTKDTNPDNDKDNETIEVVPVTDVGVTVKVNQTVVHPEDVISWNVTATNNGPSLAKDVNVTDLLPEGLEFVDVIVPDGTSYNPDTNVWTIGDLPVGEELTLVIVTKVKENATGDLTVEATVGTSSVDTNPNNDYDKDTTKVIGNSTDLIVFKIANKDKYAIGDTAKWTIVIHNTGDVDALNVKANDLLPEGVLYLSSSATQGIYDLETGVWNVGTLAAGNYVIIDIYTKVVSAGNLTNSVNVTTDTPETDYENNYATFTISVEEELVPAPENETNNETHVIENEIVKPAMLNTGNPIMALLVLLMLPLVGYIRRKE